MPKFYRFRVTAPSSMRELQRPRDASREQGENSDSGILEAAKPHPECLALWYARRTYWRPTMVKSAYSLYCKETALLGAVTDKSPSGSALAMIPEASDDNVC